jgi:hypothetical protein
MMVMVMMIMMMTMIIVPLYFGQFHHIRDANSTGRCSLDTGRRLQARDLPRYLHHTHTSQCCKYNTLIMQDCVMIVVMENKSTGRQTERQIVYVQVEIDSDGFVKHVANTKANIFTCDR